MPTFLKVVFCVLSCLMVVAAKGCRAATAQLWAGRGVGLTSSLLAKPIQTPEGCLALSTFPSVERC